MEYSKEVIDWAREKYANAPDSEKSHWECVFPFLKESEDEKIIRMIEKVVYDCNEGTEHLIGDKEVVLILDWLKKKKEQKPVEWSEDERIRKWLIEMVEELRKANPTNAEHNGNCSEAIAYLERQKDEAQKQFNLGIQAGKEEAMYEMEKEQKPAEWSEEDKEFIKELCNLLASIAKNNYVGCYYAPELVSKLQSLRPQPKQEWSNNDIEARNEIMIILSNSGKTALASWFSNAFPTRPHWKPSEEQMKAIDLAIRFVTDDFDEHPTLSETLRGLYNELKKML